MEPPPAGKRGKNLRMFSHFWDGRGYCYANKAEKPRILEWLRGEKEGAWFAAIADSGKKHVLPHTVINPAGCRSPVIRLEEQDVVEGDWGLIDSMINLLTDGVTKIEIEAGDYAVSSWQRSMNLVQDFEHTWSQERGGGWFTLCLWLAQRNEEEYCARRSTRKVREVGGGLHFGRQARVSAIRGESAQVLGSDSGSVSDGSADQCQGSGLGNVSSPESGFVGPVQGTLFGD